ncbi:hypothetical protein ACFS5L_04535 [Streptomyces phyllanthi]|uniref:Uncharacterized protein n=1 Tax=Streptomyces phyllanthi TaxID=1803180 RepID=A0A5N8WA15_9ACTN|nr:hypothetical protein [Streptomyces phyllanthi]MPY44330.1 hypothetical protein [Streptomyces phyllanthi]
MSRERRERHPKKQPETASEQVLREVEEAETHVEETDEQRRRRGEAGEAITPNRRAQEQSRHD